MLIEKNIDNNSVADEEGRQTTQKVKKEQW